MFETFLTESGVDYLPAIQVIAKAALNLAKKFAKNYLKNKAKDSGLVKILLITIASVALAIPIMFFGLFGSLLCTVVGCDDDEGLKKDVVSIKMLQDISQRMVQLREDANDNSDYPGENYGTFKVNILDQLNKNNAEKTATTDPESDTADKVTKDDLEEKAETATSVPTADYKKWLVPQPGVDIDNINPGFLARMAAIAAKYNKKIPVTSGHRSIEKQAQLYQAYLNGTGNLAAKPGYSRHNYGFALDVGGWLRQLPESTLLPYGLHKPVKTENWHIEPIETKGKASIELKDVKVDGLGSSVDLSGVGGSANGVTFTSEVSEAYVHLLALQQADENDIPFLTKDALDHAEKKKTNTGKTWTLAKKLKNEIKNGGYPDSDVKKRAKEEKWGTRQYFKLARWEIQKCYLIGDDSKSGLFEKIFGGPKPCGYIKQLTGEDIVPKKLQGVVAKTTVKKQCQKSEKGKCVDSKEVSTVVYADPQDILYKYADISLEDNKKKFKPVMKEILEILFERFAGTQSAGKNGSSASITPPFIVPLEKGTYTEITQYGSTLGDGSIAKGVIIKNGNYFTPVFSSTGGKIIGLYKENNATSVLIQNNEKQFVEYKGLSEVVLKKGDTILQGQLLGGLAKNSSLEFRICSDASVDSANPTCKTTSDPTGPPSSLKFEPGINDDTAKKRAGSYSDWKTSKSVVYMPGFSPLSTLGVIAFEGESGGDAGICVHNKGDAGGLSCGAFQIAEAVGTMDEFMGWLKTNYPEYYKAIGSVPHTLASMKPAWRNLYNSDPTGFYQAQHDFIVQTHYTDIQNSIKKDYGFDANTRSRALQEMMLSFGVQHRWKTKTQAFKSAIGNGWKSMSDKEIITKMYDYRIAKWHCCTPRFKTEKQEVLKMLAEEGDPFAKN